MIIEIIQFWWTKQNLKWVSVNIQYKWADPAYHLQK